MWKDFKKFAMKGSIVDLAIGVIIGGAFGKIVTSLVNDIIMPLIGRLLGKVDFTNLFYAFGENGKYATLAQAQEAGIATLNIGLFINNIINFLIISFSIFIVIRQLDRFKKKEEAKVTTKQCTYCLSEIPLEATRCSHCTSILEDK